MAVYLFGLRYPFPAKTNPGSYTSITAPLAISLVSAAVFAMDWRKQWAGGQNDAFEVARWAEGGGGAAGGAVRAKVEDGIGGTATSNIMSKRIQAGPRASGAAVLFV